MIHDDEPIGRILTRREAVALMLGAAGILWVKPARARTPEQTEGPFFVDEKLRRVDIREGSPGLPLALTLQVFHSVQSKPVPLAGATVDLWHCDAKGVYSDVEDARGKKFLRGYQVTDAAGKAHFTTIYPGSYPGRTVHIHFKIRHKGSDFTSQLYFDDKLSDHVLSQAPYQTAPKRTRNDDDGIYADGGKELMLKLSPAGKGYVSQFAVGLT